MSRSIAFTTKVYDVEVQTTFGDVLFVYRGVPANSHDEEAQLVKGKLRFSASLVSTGGTNLTLR